MFWILRRTGAVNFFNSLNNNCSFTKGNGSNHNNNNGTQDKYVKRPPRKAYGRLSGDADGADSVSLQHKIDDPFDDLDNFDMITPGKGNGNGNANRKMATNDNGNGSGSGSGAAMSLNECTHPVDVTDGVGGGVGVNGVDRVGNGIAGVELQCTSADCQGNFMENVDDLCELDLCIGHGTSNVYKSKSGKTVNEQTINRLHALALAGDDEDNDDYEESLTCNVCDRAFHCHRQLASHQQKKRHFGCSGCDSLFPSLMLLEHHKEEFEHWSDDDLGPHSCCRRNRCDDDYFTDTDSFISDAESEDLERLL